MKVLRTATMAATALIAAAALTGGTAALASPAYTYIGTGIGTGATSAAAENAAVSDLYGSYAKCSPPITLVYDHQEGGATWYAEVKGNCSGMLT